MPNNPQGFTFLHAPDGGRPWKRFGYNAYNDTVCCWCGVRVPQGNPVIFRSSGGFLHPACWAQKHGRTAALQDPRIPKKEFPPVGAIEEPQASDTTKKPAEISTEELDALCKDL